MAETIPWDSPAGGNDGWSGTLRQVVERWNRMESLEEKALLGVSISQPVQLEGWPAPRSALNNDHLSELAERLVPTLDDKR